MLLLQMDEVTTALAQVVDQLVLLVHDFVEDGLVVYAVDDLLVDADKFGLDRLEVFPLDEFLLLLREFITGYDKEFQCSEIWLCLISTGPVRNAFILSKHCTVILVTC